MLMIDSLVDENGILTTENAFKYNISKPEFYKFIKENKLEKVAHGIYAKKDSWVDPLMLVIKRCPHAVVSHDEALYHYGLIDREPLKPTITVYSGYNKTSLKHSGYKVYSVKKELVELGKVFVTDQFGNLVPMYDVERTICDLARSRSQFEVQDFNTAIKSYARRTDKNLGRLFEYAKQFGVEKILRAYLEVLL